MLRFIAFAWDPSTQAPGADFPYHGAQLRRPGAPWSRWFQAGGLCVYGRIDAPAPFGVHRLTNRGGVVLGALFESLTDTTGAPVPQITHFTESQSREILASGGRSLTQSFWGKYVAFIHSGELRTSWILRGPFGSIPCLTTKIGDVRAYFSYFPDLATLTDKRWSINSQYIFNMLTKLPQNGATGLCEVSDIQPGECESVTGVSAKHTRYWDALDVARSYRVHDLLTATRLVRHTGQACVRSWAAPFGKIMVRLSGGLDSSGVLGFLAPERAPASLLALNRYSTAYKEDERPYARRTATHLGCELIELERDPSFNIQELYGAAFTERPEHYLGQLTLGRAEIDIAKEHSIQAIFNGVYGDQLFLAGNYHLAAADYLFDHGISRSFFGYCLSSARISKTSWWKVLPTAFANGLVKRRWSPNGIAQVYNGLLSDEALQSLRQRVARDYPWFDRSRYVPPGKQFHVFSVLAPDHCYGPFYDPSHPPLLAPLLSQPLVELCLRIPTYLHARDGWDRAIERLAVEPDLPRETSRRRSKGGQASVTPTIIGKNLEHVRDLLLHGSLVQQGLISRKKLEPALVEGPAPEVLGPARLSRCINIEIWMRLFQAHLLRRAA